jgi:CHAT domain-containing protein/tetratricopeptide (TPR) repeat protein
VTDQESTTDLLRRADAAYRVVVANPELAAPEVAQLLSEVRQDGNPRALVSVLRAAAWFERSQLRHDRAAALLDEAVRIGRRHRLDAELRQALTTRGAVRHEQGRLTAAKRDFEQAASLLGDADDPELDAQRAALLQNSGQLTAAADLYRRILRNRDTPLDVRAKAANNLGLIEVWCGRADTALSWLDVAAEAAREVGPGSAAFVAASRAWATVRAGRLQQGLELYDEAEARWRESGIPLAELYAEHADALADLRLIPEAIRQAERAVVALDEHGFALIAAEAQLRLARLTLLEGQPRAAAATADLVATRLRGHGRAAWASQARLVSIDAHLATCSAEPDDLAVARRAAATLERAGLVAEAVDGHLTAGRVAATFGRSRLALDAWRRAEQVAHAAPLLVRLKGRLAGALAAELTERPDVVVRRARAGLEDLARHRAALPSAELRARASAHGAELGRLGLAAIAGRRPAADVLLWMERTRSAALGSVDPPEVAGIEEELGLLRATQSDIAEAKREGAARLTDLLARQAALEERIRKATWNQRSSIDAPDRWRPISEIRASLGGQTLVEYDVLDSTIVAAVLTARRSRLAGLGPIESIRRQLDDLSFALRRLARHRSSAASLAAARSGAEDALGALTSLLVEPLALGTPSGVVVVPVGELQNVPWTALLDTPVAVAPSAAMWVRTATRPPPARERVSLIAGPELEGAVAEVRALAAVHDTADVIVPPRSDTAAVTRSLAASSLAHLACHGSVRSDNPMFSSLLVTDGPLTVHELDRRGIAPHRMILAACESSADTVYPGNEALGFVSTLLAGGTSGLIASSVVIPDWNVVRLMTALHTALRAGSTMAVALHEARADVDLSDPAGFVSWCAFNAFGAA